MFGVALLLEMVAAAVVDLVVGDKCFVNAVITAVDTAAATIGEEPALTRRATSIDNVSSSSLGTSDGDIITGCASSGTTTTTADVVFVCLIGLSLPKVVNVDDDKDEEEDVADDDNGSGATEAAFVPPANDDAGIDAIGTTTTSAPVVTVSLEGVGLMVMLRLVVMVGF